MRYAAWIASGLAALLLGPGASIADPGHGHAKFAAGEPGNPKRPSRVIPITMRDMDDGKMKYFPDSVEVRRGEQVKFILRNSGKADHEFLLDSIDNNAKHKIEMEKNPDMEHDDPNGKRLQANKTAEIIWRFTKAGTFEYACLIPGHYEAGMKGIVIVK